MYITHIEALANKGFTVNAYADTKTGKLIGIEATMSTSSVIATIIAQFPKSVKLSAFNRQVNFRASFNSDGVTGDKNETSIKRTRKFFETCDKLGLVLKFDDVHCRNQIMTREEVERALRAPFTYSTRATTPNTFEL